MKILMVHNSYQQQGGEDVVFEQEHRVLEDAGHTVVTYRRSNWELDFGSIVGRIEAAAHTVWSSESHRQIARLLNREKPDIVHVHNTFIVISPSIFSACREAGIPVVQTLHNYRLFCPAATFFRNGRVCEECVQHGIWRSVAYRCYRHSRPATAAVAVMLSVHRLRKTWTHEVSVYIALTEFSRRLFIRAGLPPEKIVVKPNFVLPDPGERTETGDYSIFVGRLSPEKRVSTVLAAWSRLRNRIPLTVIGGGPELQTIQQEGSRLNLTNVDFRGPLPRTQTVSAIRRARFLIFSSEWYENFPVTIAESFACGVPVIASRLGAMQELIEHRRTGLLFRPGDPQDLAEKVDWAWEHPDEMKRMGAAARQEYEMKYTAEKNYAALLNIYEQTIDAAKRGQGPPAELMHV